MTKGAFSEEQKSHKYLLKPGTGVLYVEKLDGLIAFRVSNILLQILGFVMNKSHMIQNKLKQEARAFSRQRKRKF